MLNAFNIHQFQILGLLWALDLDFKVKTLLRLDHARDPFDKQSYATPTYP